jgi:DNA modification methylase
VKPLGVMDWLVRLATRPGQLVLDAFAGTGTTLEACFLAGAKSVGIEQVPEYGLLAEQRLQRAGTFLES